MFMRIVSCLLVVFIFTASAFAQVMNSPDSSMVLPDSSRLPIIKFETENFFLTKAFYPDYHTGENEVWQDIFGVEQKAASLMAFWKQWGDSILKIIPELSGIPWIEPGLKIHLMKYLPVPGLYDPLAVPIEGIKQSLSIEAAPSGYLQYLEFLQFLSGRNLLQVEYPGDTLAAINNHPLLDQGMYRFDVIAMLLAVSVGDKIFPSDTLQKMLGSSLWQRHFPGWRIYKTNFRSKWVLSIDHPLIQYLRDEPFNSPLVELTAPPKDVLKTADSSASPPNIKSPSVGGRLGFLAVRQGGGNYLVTVIDSTKLAYACGLRKGDRIRTVDGIQPGTFSEMMGKIIDKLDAEGAYLEINRGGDSKGILIRAPSKN